MLIGGDQTWGTKGNYGINSETDFIDTIDNQDLIFKRGNVQAGLLSSISTYNTSFGVGSYKGTPKGAYAGRWNTAIGYYALAGKDGSVIGHDNTAIGANALVKNYKGENNVAIGSASLYYNTSGSIRCVLAIKKLLLYMVK